MNRSRYSLGQRWLIYFAIAYPIALIIDIPIFTGAFSAYSIGAQLGISLLWGFTAGLIGGFIALSYLGRDWLRP